jgi:hypothetical protein
MLLCAIETLEGDSWAGWLRDTTLASLSELNEECLELCLLQARAGSAPALCAELAQLLSALDGAARRRAAACHYLLMDAGLAQLGGAPAAAAPHIEDAEPSYAAAWFTVPAAAVLTQAVFAFAWHLSRHQGSAARLLLGMPAGAVQRLAQCTLGQARLLAQRQSCALRPRWALQPRAWRQLFAAAASGDPGALERARLRGQTLIAAETRLAAAPSATVGRAPLPAPRRVHGYPKASSQVADA